jgi:hypothetical protein
MIWLLGGFALLMLFVLALNAFTHADPARLARRLIWLAIIALVIVAGVFVWRQNTSIAWFCGGAAVILYAGLRRSAYGRAASGQKSDVETEWLRMSLDHGTGETAGVVLQGVFSGMNLSELGPDELLTLLRELRVADPQSALLLEAYISRVHPDLDGDDGAHESSTVSVGAMSREQALEILGLEAGASADDIRAAHRRLMQQMHPDKGGSDYLAAQINRARDVLLG